MMQREDELIFSYERSTADRDYDDAAYQSIAKYSLMRLGEMLGRELLVDMQDGISVGRGFSLDARTSDAEKPWKIGIRAIVGADVIEDKLVVRSWIFFYSGNARLSPEDGSEFLELEYIQSPAGRGEWKNIGWGSGELGEFDSFSTFE